MSREITDLDLVEMTSNIACAMLSNNTVAVGDVASLITSIHGALKSTLVEITHEPAKVIQIGKVSERASIKPDHLISMIDGKPYKMLKRHIALHGYTPESYRTAFGLKVDYPMTSPLYSQQRSDLAKKSGLGKKDR